MVPLYTVQQDKTFYFLLRKFVGVYDTAFTMYIKYKYPFYENKFFMMTMQS